MTKPWQFHFRKHSYVFKVKIGFFVLCFMLFSLCLALGVWQLHRYANKKTLLATYHARLHGAPLAFAKLTHAHDLQFQSVFVEGQYLNQFTMFVQNRFYHDALGYEVLTPLHILRDKKLLLVDRGWVPKPPDKSLPSIQNTDGMQQVKGYIKVLDEYQFILGKNILQDQLTPLVMQKIDMNEISRVLQQSFYPFILRLDASQSHGFVRDWIITTMLPERHMAYAVQWFLLAIVLCIAYFCFCCERTNE
ncbi:MAG: hypothetical protein ACD_45C00630G0004 [uncultured bacterium]|nr:MAG: hypothetical protein ACD_45C00630G0004 [uncultured bacterium]